MKVRASTSIRGGNINFNFIQDTSTRNTVKDIYYQIKIHEKTGKAYVSDFLNPVVQGYILDILNKSKISYKMDGGGNDSERKILVLGHDPQPGFRILCLESKDINFSHRDVLGSILALGLERDKLGDIVFLDRTVEVAVKANEAYILLSSLNKVKNSAVSTSIKDSSKFEESNVVDEEFKGSVASLRLDCIIGEMAKTSRTKAQDLIGQGKIKLNHIEERKPGAQVGQGDLISISGIGRFVVRDLSGKSRKNRTFINYIKKG